jgi:hypothetical protein
MAPSNMKKQHKYLSTAPNREISFQNEETGDFSPFASSSKPVFSKFRQLLTTSWEVRAHADDLKKIPHTPEVHVTEYE